LTLNCQDLKSELEGGKGFDPKLVFLGVDTELSGSKDTELSESEGSKGFDPKLVFLGVDTELSESEDTDLSESEGGKGFDPELVGKDGLLGNVMKKVPFNTSVVLSCIKS